LWATFIAAITPSAEPKLLRSQNAFWVQKNSFQKNPWIIVFSQHFSHGAAGCAYATFIAVFEFLNI